MSLICFYNYIVWYLYVLSVQKKVLFVDIRRWISKRELKPYEKTNPGCRKRPSIRNLGDFDSDFGLEYVFLNLYSVDIVLGLGSIRLYTTTNNNWMLFLAKIHPKSAK